ncbi:MAG: dihydroorotate dehydrogenase electron transfer subunit [Endomicrobium sp.]|jgi:dihydroorotate dehydrogenase electron transfer subunit|nr:dihydroorotate dehydrogenase electron transfer subunit [Endomicrobium sp.]
MFDKYYKIISNTKLKTNYYNLTVFIDDKIIKNCIPGQFFMIKIPDFFLCRPFSIYNIDFKNNKISFLYKVIGYGTKKLSEIKSGNIRMLGPLGIGYNLKICNKLGVNNDIAIIAGGTGIVSVNSLLLNLIKPGELFYGVQSEKDFLNIDKFKKNNWKITISSEDGSIGYKGNIINLFIKRLENKTYNKKLIIFACGPKNMLKKILYIAKKNNIDGFISLEGKMACGVGNCQSCAIKINNEIKMVCKDGPVFRIKDINFE